MSNVVNEVVAANQAYSQAFGAKGELPLPPARQFAILTCMDARLDPDGPARSEASGLGNRAA
jgi:carbonic anhydrase